MSVFDDVPAEDDVFSKAAGAMNEQQLTDDEVNAIVDRVSTGNVDPHNPLHAILREVRYQLRAQPPVQIGTELGEFIGVGPASDARYTNFDRPGTSLVKYEPTNSLSGGFNEIILEPLPEPVSRFQRSSMMLAAAALVVVAMVVGAGISRSFAPVDQIIDVEGPAGAPSIYGSSDTGTEAPPAPSLAEPVAEATDAPAADADENETLADMAEVEEVVEPEPEAEVVTTFVSADVGGDDDAEVPASNQVERDRSPNSEPEAVDPTAVPPTSTPEPTAVPAETAPPAAAVVVPSSTPSPVPTTAPTSTPVPTATATPAPTSTPIPTATPVPTSTPRPTATATPTPPPTATAIPTATPSPTPSPTSTPRPTATPTSTPIPPTPIGD